MSQTSKFVELPTGAVVDVTNIAFILRGEINKYLIVPKQSVAQAVPHLDGNEFEALKAYLGVEKMPYTAPEVPEKDKPLIKVVGNDDTTKTTRV